MDKYTPLGDIVLIEVDEPITKTASGIIVKEDWKTLPPTGTVIAVGDEAEMEFVGKRVVFERYSAVTLDGNLRLCKNDNILAIVNA